MFYVEFIKIKLLDSIHSIRMLLLVMLIYHWELFKLVYWLVKIMWEELLGKLTLQGIYQLGEVFMDMWFDWLELDFLKQLIIILVKFQDRFVKLLKLFKIKLQSKFPVIIQTIQQMECYKKILMILPANNSLTLAAMGFYILAIKHLLGKVWMIG